MLQGGLTLQVTLPAPESAYHLSRLPTSHLHLHPCGAGSTVKFYVFFWVEGAQISVPQEITVHTKECCQLGGKEPFFSCRTVWLHIMVARAAGWEGKTRVLLSAPHSLHFFLLNRPQVQYGSGLSPSFLSAIPLSFLPAQSIPQPHYMPLHGGRDVLLGSGSGSLCGSWGLGTLPTCRQMH